MNADPRRGKWIPLVYYYLATLVGLGILLAGLISGLQSAVEIALPKTSDEFRYSRETPFDRNGNPVKLNKKQEEINLARDVENARNAGIAGTIRGFIAALVAFPAFFWHLRQARRKEPEWFGAIPPS